MMIDMPTLLKLTSQQALDEACNALDLLSINSMKIDKRGRIEAGVKPAPPSTLPASYVKITKRSNRFTVDCRMHGKTGWCLHGLMLALHYLGKKPTYQTKKPPSPSAETPAVGFKLEATFETDGVRFSVLSRTTGRHLVNPLRYILRERKVLGLSERALELFEDLAEAHEHAFTVPRSDMSALLQVLADVPLFEPMKGESFTWQKSRHPAPKLRVRIQGQHIHLKFEPEIDDSADVVPGWPGFLIYGTEIHRFDEYVADFQWLLELKGQTLPLTAANLAPLLREKHQIHWETPRPRVIVDPIEKGLRLRPQGRGLVGDFGFWDRETFFPLQDLTQKQQFLHEGGESVFFSASPWFLRQCQKEREGLRVPWNSAHTSFQIREHQAPSFLDTTRFPNHWRTQRKEADRWFGMTSLTIDSIWSEEDGRPIYQIDGRQYRHSDLIGQIVDGGAGARFSDGRILKADFRQVLRNEKVLGGVAALHDRKGQRRQLLRRLLDPDSVPTQAPLQIPARWEKQLRSYQKAGLIWLLENFHRGEPSLLADDMGLGKTIQTLAFLDMVKQDKPQLIVVPTSLIVNWAEEVDKFCKHRRLYSHHGPNRKKAVAYLQKQDLVITSYGTVRRDIELFYDIEFQVTVLDEAQAIKNAASQTSQALNELWCEHRIALTGTPVENRLSELWSIFHFLAPGYLGDEQDIRAITMPGTPAFEAVKTQVRPFLKRRLKREVERDLPEKQEVIIRLPLLDHQRDLYSQRLRDSRRDLDSASSTGKVNAVSILTKLLRLRQISCHPGLLGDEWISGGSNKLAFLMEQLPEVLAEGHAVLVFSQFTRFLKLVRHALEESELSYLYLDGQTRDRQALVHRFQQGEAPIFLISLKAGGTGLNLTRASYVYHLDPWWNPMVEAQATDRAHRIGQTRKVISYKLISENTVEERILRLQAEKRFMAEGLWQDPQQLLETMDREQLLGLFQ